jgi:heparan-alpha-glucosaminide N-acetyltransferase
VIHEAKLDVGRDFTFSFTQCMNQADADTTVARTAVDSPPDRNGTSKTTRLVSLDAYRGFVMLLMASEGLRLGLVARHFPDSSIWQFLAYQTEHVEWRGCTLWDLIQPSFMFMVGVAMPFSLASRKGRGDTFNRLLGHTLWRSLALIALGIFLRSVGRRQTYFTFEDVLTQIGLGYTFLFLVAWTKPKVQFGIGLVILVVYWAAFALYPLPGADFDFQKVGVPADWQHLTGFAAHWDKNTNFAAAFDQWFLNLFPREKPFVFNSGGYLTLSFVPSLATMVFGLLAGNILRQQADSSRKVRWLVITGIGGLALGKILDMTGICPSVKRIWSPGWVIFSTGWTCLLLAFFYSVVDWKGYKKLAFPLVVVGMNSIAMYVMAHLFFGFIQSSLKINLGVKIFTVFGTVYAPILETFAVLFILWLICLWMYRRKLFLKI